MANLGIIIALSLYKERLIMPIYEYQCVDCGGRDQQVAGLDDHMALCPNCGGLMLRLDEDVFLPFFAEIPETSWP